MNRLAFILGLAGCLLVTKADFTCNTDDTGYPTQLCYDDACANAIKKHIKKEFNAAFTYMHMASYFDQNTINRQGLAKFFFEAASEERGHAIQMLDYLNLRGMKLENIPGTPPEVFPDYTFDNTKLTDEYDYKNALEKALENEIEVTDSIAKVVADCGKDFHGADFFTNPILDEQHNGIRKLQGAIKYFDNLKVDSCRDLAEYLFDKKMMSGEFWDNFGFRDVRKPLFT